MSLYKIDGQVLSVNELYQWIGSFITLFRNGKINTRKLPADIVAAFGDNDDNKVADRIIIYLRKDEEYIKKLIRIVKKRATDIAVEREMKK